MIGGLGNVVLLLDKNFQNESKSQYLHSPNIQTHYLPLTVTTTHYLPLTITTYYSSRLGNAILLLYKNFQSKLKSQF